MQNAILLTNWIHRQLRRQVLTICSADSVGNASLIAQFYQGLKDRVKNNTAQKDQPTQLQKMITMTVKIDDRQFEQELEKKETYFFGKGYPD